jgi:prepilin-type N-terminal cleavage/methylation domain-containing protein
MDKQVYGFSLLEFLVALFIFSTGLMGCLKLISVSERMSQHGLWRSLAHMQLLNGYAVIQAHQYSFLSLWQQQSQQLLPQATAMVRYNSSSVDVSLAWHQPQKVMLVLHV